jgi:hypothetical protein
MGYWKREYTERRTGRQLFRPERRDEIRTPPTPGPSGAPAAEDETDRSDRHPG